MWGENNILMYFFNKFIKYFSNDSDSYVFHYDT